MRRTIEPSAGGQKGRQQKNGDKARQTTAARCHRPVQQSFSFGVKNAAVLQAKRVAYSSRPRPNGADVLPAPLRGGLRIGQSRKIPGLPRRAAVNQHAALRRQQRKPNASPQKRPKRRVLRSIRDAAAAVCRTWRRPARRTRRETKKT
jgi:hypothetical protein